MFRQDQSAILSAVSFGRVMSWPWSRYVQRGDEAEFGPVMQAYLGYLRNEQEVVDDRASRREITADYYRRNSNRIRALRQMAIRLVTKTGNDYVPELEAVATDELRIMFENPPNPTNPARQSDCQKYISLSGTGEQLAKCFMFSPGSIPTNRPR